MSVKRIVVWLVILSLALGRTAALAQSHEQGVAAGRAANPSIRGLINTPSASTVVPGYTATPPETAYAGRPSLNADANARLAACALTPNDPTCQALRNAVTSANTARPFISPSDPAVAAASRIVRNPSVDLGSLAAYYSGCATSDVTTPARTETRSCARTVGVGTFACSNALTVAVERSINCTPGDWFAHAGWGATGLDVQCIPDRPETRQHFRVTQGGGPLTFFDVNMTTPVAFPELVGVIGTTYSMLDGRPIRTGVWASDKSCTGNSCTLTAMIADEAREWCDGDWDRGLSCTTTEPFTRIYAACRPGTLSGENIVDSGYDGDNYWSVALNATTCYAPADGAGGAYRGVDMTGTFPTATSWNLDSNRAVVGWTQNPAYGPIPTMTLTYTRPQTTVATTDTWNSQCPTLAGGGRCTVASAPSCVDGPSTKVIDGFAVTRPCWEYQSTMSCAGAVAADQCAPLVAAGCTPIGSTCRQTNAATGACEVYQDDYRCAVPGETVTTADNCPSNVFCVGTSCFNIAYTNDADFARSMSMLEAAREAGVYLDTDRMQVFTGEPNRCRDRLLTNCCYTDNAGRGMTNQSVFGSGSSLVYDILMNSENQQFIYQGLNALIANGGFAGTFSAYGMTIAVNGAALPAGSTVLYSSTAVAGEGFVIAFDPWSLVIMVIIYIIMSLLSCDEQEARLALKEGAGLCHSVGTFCSSCIRVLGSCVSCTTQTTSKCCFNSMLSRIINQQGRPQVGKGWGDARNPDCSGFTVAQLQSLDFARMDFTEFYASLVPASPDLAAWQSNNASRVPTCYFGQGRCQ